MEERKGQLVQLEGGEGGEAAEGGGSEARAPQSETVSSRRAPRHPRLEGSSLISGSARKLAAPGGSAARAPRAGAGGPGTKARVERLKAGKGPRLGSISLRRKQLRIWRSFRWWDMAAEEGGGSLAVGWLRERGAEGGRGGTPTGAGAPVTCGTAA